MNAFLWQLKSKARGAVPPQLMALYHFSVAVSGAFVYGFPSRGLTVIAVTGTKGKSSTTEFLNAIFEADGRKTALLNSIRIKVADQSDPNLMRMSMPGRFFIQRFLRGALDAGCAVAILEMTSEGARQYRQRAIDLDGLIFTNLAPEHIESHGSLEAYADAKFQIGRQLQRSKKRPRVIVANADDREASRYLALDVEEKVPFTLSGNAPYAANDKGGHFQFGDAVLSTRLPGEFSLKNALAASTMARAFGVSTSAIMRGLDKLGEIPGRAQRIEAGQPYAVVVDYAHTPDSLQALYDAYAGARKICVMGATGGGRDLWKRPVMGSVADAMCDTVILADEDPYDEDPRSILDMLAKGMKRQPTMILDRREAIAHAISLAQPGDAVLITGKGTDPCICVEQGKKIPWSDAAVAREEIEKSLSKPAL